MSAIAVPLLFCALLVGGLADLGDTTENDFKCPPAKAFEEKHVPQRVPIEREYFLPVLSSKPPARVRVHLALIVLHGSARNAEEYYNNMIAVAGEAKCGAFASSVIAPAIPSVKAGEECTGSDWGEDGSSTEKALTWSGTTEWALGNKDDRGEVSSFRALDKVVEWALASWKQTLRAVVVTGFSTGAQLALRWSIFSPHGENGRTSGQGLDMRVIISSPSTVTYLNDNRPIENCTEDEATTQNFSCPLYALPETGSRRRGTAVQRTCEGGWDDYQYGLNNLEEAADATVAKDVWNYIVGTQYNPGEGTNNGLRTRFATKDIRFLVGSEDIKSCGEGSCSDSCGAMVTGTNRLQRMLNYMGHLEEVTGKTPNYAVFPGQHEHLLAFRSSSFLEWGFPGLIDPVTGECDVSSQTSTDGATSLMMQPLLTALLCLGAALPLTR